MKKAPAKKPAKAAAKTPAKPAGKESSNIGRLVGTVLSSPTSELAVRRQMIELARQNLHLPDVVSALVTGLTKVSDKETRDTLLDLLMSVETSRLPSLKEFHDALIGLFKENKERALRASLMRRLQDGIRQDDRLALFFIDVLSTPVLNDTERAAVTDAVASFPAISESTAVLALERGASGDASIQDTAVAIAERCPTWNDAVIKALQPYLDVKRDPEMRTRILERLAKAKALTPAYFPLLKQILRHDPDGSIRSSALEILRSIKPWDEEIFEQLVWTASKDSESSLRARAVALQAEGPELSDAQLEKLAGRLALDTSVGVRLGVLAVLKDSMRVAGVRTAVAASFAANPGVFDDSEFDSLLDLLAPYAGRDAAIRDSLLKAVETLPRAPQRARVLQLVLPKVKVETALAPLVRLFKRERDAGVRTTLFEQLKPLSVTRHPELVTLYCTELTEPGSPFRSACAGILGAAADTNPEIPPALEDVLRNDQDRELIRLCLDGYLKPRVEKSFDVLVEVVGNEMLDTGSRQRCLDEILKLKLTEDQAGTLAETMAGLKPNTLRVPK